VTGYNRLVQVASGKVVDGRVIFEGELPEGADVTLIAVDGEEVFTADGELEAVLLESMAQGRRGDVISADELLAEMRSRE
jgi:hypothetical protein